MQVNKPTLNKIRHDLVCSTAAWEFTDDGKFMANGKKAKYSDRELVLNCRGHIKYLLKYLEEEFTTVYGFSYNPVKCNPELLEQMDIVREITSLGNAARKLSGIKSKMPLNRIYVRCPFLVEAAIYNKVELLNLIKDELNVFSIVFTDDLTRYLETRYSVDYKLAGKNLGDKTNILKAWLESQKYIDLSKEDLEVPELGLIKSKFIVETVKPLSGVNCATNRGISVVLDTEITPSLLNHYYMAELIRYVQDKRKELQLDYSDKIKLLVSSNNAGLNVLLEDRVSKLTHTLQCSEVLFSRGSEKLIFDEVEIYVSVRRIDD